MLLVPADVRILARQNNRFRRDWSSRPRLHVVGAASVLLDRQVFTFFNRHVTPSEAEGNRPSAAIRFLAPSSGIEQRIQRIPMDDVVEHLAPVRLSPLESDTAFTTASETGSSDWARYIMVGSDMDTRHDSSKLYRYVPESPLHPHIDWV